VSAACNARLTQTTTSRPPHALPLARAVARRLRVAAGGMVGTVGKSASPMAVVYSVIWMTLRGVTAVVSWAWARAKRGGRGRRGGGRDKSSGTAAVAPCYGGPGAAHLGDGQPRGQYCKKPHPLWPAITGGWGRHGGGRGACERCGVRSTVTRRTAAGDEPPGPRSIATALAFKMLAIALGRPTCAPLPPRHTARGTCPPKKRYLGNPLHHLARRAGCNLQSG
jgi:hypothetical protein